MGLCFFKQKTAYEMRISDWSSDVCSSDLGHNRSVGEIVNAALQEDVQGLCITSYQGGHTEFFKYMVDLLRANGGENIKIYGGGGGVIVPAEIKELMGYGVARLYSPEDGASMGLQGMINDVIRGCDYDLTPLAPQRSEAHTSELQSLMRIS